MAGRKPGKAVTTPELDSEPLPSSEAAVSRTKALVFISHDSRDADLAESFANLLLDVSGGTLKSFRSSDKKGTSGIEFGAEWYASIMSQLADATDVVALLTSQSVDRPWILYEAGVAKGKLETTVFGVSLGVPLETVSTGPFGQFQNCGGDEDSLTKLVMQLMRKNPDAAPREEAVRMQIKLFRQKVDEALKSRGKKEIVDRETSDEQNIAKLFEEVKAMVRELPERVDDRMISLSRRGPSRKFRRYSPRLIDDLAFGQPLGGVDEDGALGTKVILSMLRDDYPWIYETGIEFCQAVESGNKTKIEKALSQMHSIIEFTIHGPLREFGPEEKDTLFALQRLHDIIEHSAARAHIVRSERKSSTRLGGVEP